jgi:putative hydrolase of the HAD superfamily
MIKSLDEAQYAALSEIAFWVFDLDNTLYPASTSLFPQMDVRMRQFVSELLGVSLEEAFRIQKQYYHEHGTTLRGLMLRHGVEPDVFLDYVHDLDHSVLEPAPRLDEVLERLPGCKLIFTNGSEKHAENVMRRLGVERHFSGIFDIKASNYVPKPHPETYALMVRRHGVEARKAAMFEDIHKNLVAAHAIGMITVWVRQHGHPDFLPRTARAEIQQPGELAHVHHVTEDLLGWLEAVEPRLIRPSGAAAR